MKLEPSLTNLLVGYLTQHSIFVFDNVKNTQIWKLYRPNRLPKAVDPCVGDDVPATESSRVLIVQALKDMDSPDANALIQQLTKKE